MAVDLNQNHFELFGLPARFAVEPAGLEARYRELQREVHPDRFAAAPDAERRMSMQLAARVNEAYQTLKSPLKRAVYILQLRGVDPKFETNTAMPQDFLVQQMELREELERAAGERDLTALERLHTSLARQKRELDALLARRIDAERDYAGAAGLVREFMFLDKLEAEIGAAFERIE